MSRREARDWRDSAREVLANSWSFFTLNWPKDVREAVFDLKGGERQFLNPLESSYLLCRSSSCTRSSPSPASAPPSGGGSPRATPPCPSPSQTRCGRRRLFVHQASTRRKWGKHEKNLSALVKKVPSCCRLTSVGGCGLTFCKIYYIGCLGVGLDRMRVW